MPTLASRMCRLLPSLAALPLIAVFVAFLAAEARSLAAPEPEVVPRRWQLQVEPGPLRITTVDVPGEGPQHFYYFTYTVTNNTGEDIFFAPSFELATDDGTIVRSGRGIPLEVVDTIKERLNNPFLEDETQIKDILRQGRENAKDGLVIWPANNLKVDEITIYGAGFSGETRTYPRPDTGEPVLLRKTMMLRHHVPGTLDPGSDKPIERTTDRIRWILRKEAATLPDSAQDAEVADRTPSAEQNR